MNELIELVEKYISLVEDEMCHGCYTTPDSPPALYNYETYYDDHEKIVLDTIIARTNLIKFIERNRSSNA